MASISTFARNFAKGKNGQHSNFRKEFRETRTYPKIQYWQLGDFDWVLSTRAPRRARAEVSKAISVSQLALRRLSALHVHCGPRIIIAWRLGLRLNLDVQTAPL
jgi:hypothetical protein